MTLVFLYGQMKPGLAAGSLRRFIDEVMPAFSDPVQTAERIAAAASFSD
jgi:hypothetical protein